jgi:hypothetical protein
MKSPLDTFPYPQDPRSQPLIPGLADGGYAYVQDTNGIIIGVPDEPHVHPKILGGCRPAMYAGDLTIRDGKIADVTNLSGTFQFDDEAGLLAVADQLRHQGFVIEVGAVRIFPSDGSRPVILE